MGYTGVEAAGYNDGQFYGLSPADFKQSIESVGMEVLLAHLKASGREAGRNQLGRDLGMVGCRHPSP